MLSKVFCSSTNCGCTSTLKRRDVWNRRNSTWPNEISRKGRSKIGSQQARTAEPANDGVDADEIRVSGLLIRKTAQTVTLGGKPLHLTPTEFRLLECLLRQPGRAFTRHQLMDAAIGDSSIVLERTIDVHVKSLRRKLGGPDLIETVRGVGYRFKEPVAAVV